MIYTGLLQGICLGLLFYCTYKLKWKPLFSSWFLGPYKVSKIGYGLFLYALQSAKHTSASFMGAILEEYLVRRALLWELEGLPGLNNTGHQQTGLIGGAGERQTWKKLTPWTPRSSTFFGIFAKLAYFSANFGSLNMKIRNNLKKISSW